ncbi:3-oxo-5-alpha-steroid 4-dehydrogenase 1 [Strongylocentrotus purpuratus]|uniref:3-oxo-5alpha-steroid 4-dehydrogenase (NADP(+)) n=1 Tax=Strongylocentrotus purpuratus TaxID=7668 RepID=A0A7M7GLX6_STRPU|nr:3-oxo-5-alpha-steroid 4-dehydrogenase 1 [Strongylocentrotus purpuratus]
MSCVGFLEPIIGRIGGNEPAFLDMMAYFMMFCGFLAGAVLSAGIRTPYGRYTSPKFGWGLESRTAWFIQELPSFAVPVLLILFCNNQYSSTLPNTILVGYYLVHYFQRTFLFSLLIRGGKVTPLVPFVLATIFCCYNGFMQGRYLTQYAVYSQDWMKDPRFILGSLLFMTGMAINIHSDYILRNLRKPGETGYKIPCGGMFDYVSGANFFGEIVEWIGFSIACWSLQGLAFAFFTFCVVSPRAWQHHLYYLEKFEDYPKSRKAVIPFIL